MSKLTVKQEAFCLHYAKTGNATESYLTAGYKATTNGVARTEASKLLTKPNIQARLKELADEVHDSSIADIKEIHQFLTSVIRGETTEDVVVTEGCGEGVSEAKIVQIRTNNVARIKAATELAKMKGGYDSKVQVEIAVPVFGGEDCLED